MIHVHEVRRWPNTKARNMTVDPINHYKIEARMVVAQSRLRVGQDCFGTGWTRRMEQQKKKMSEFGGQEGLCDLRNDEREALGRTRTQDLEKLSNQTKKGKSRENWSRQIHQLPSTLKVLRYKCVEIATWQKNRSIFITRWDKSFREQFDIFRKHCTHGGTGKLRIHWHRLTTT